MKQPNINPLTNNARMICEIKSPEFGRVLVVPVGGIVADSIQITVEAGQELHKGDPIGCFGIGGSVVLTFFQENCMTFDDDILKNTSERHETLVRANTKIGISALTAPYNFAAENDSIPVDPTVVTVDDLDATELIGLTPLERRSLAGRYGATKFARKHVSNMVNKIICVCISIYFLFFYFFISYFLLFFFGKMHFYRQKKN